MSYKIDDNYYNVNIIKKRNKNTYIRLKDDLTIQVTTGFFTTKKDVERLLDKNIDSLRNMLYKRQSSNAKNNKFYYLGEMYDIIYKPCKNVEVINGNIYVSDEKMLNKWYREEMIEIFSNRIKHYYDLFEEKIPFPKLKIRTMKTRWGVCNRKDNSITLNTGLMQYGYFGIDYVIVHELSHFVHFNHSNAFWNTVSKYYPNYKEVRKMLKE